MIAENVLTFVTDRESFLVRRSRISALEGLSTQICRECLPLKNNKISKACILRISNENGELHLKKGERDIERKLRESDFV